MSQLLKEWYCDVCGSAINDAKDGYVIWRSDVNHKYHGFKIIHQAKCDIDSYPFSSALEDFIGEDGLAKLLSMLSLGPIKAKLNAGRYCHIADIDEFVDFIRRVQTPHYEEARRNFSDANLVHDYSDANEVAPYLQRDLQNIIKSY